MYETMTVHRAMVELKTIDKRIAKKIENAAFCTSAKVNMKKLFGQPAEEFYRQAQSDFDSITGLINRAAAIKAAIPVSNAKTKIKVNEQEMKMRVKNWSKNITQVYINIVCYISMIPMRLRI